MPIARAANVDIYYETFGEETDPAIVLIMGLGGQSIAWDTEFCELLAGDGHYVVRFDNRDAGMSTKFDGAHIEAVAIVTAALAGEKIEVPYTLSDMAGDTLGLMDHLGMQRAHLVGVSMGGMIAQTLAAEYSERVASLTSIMSSTGSRSVGQPTPEAVMVLFERPPADRAGSIEAAVRAQRVIGSPDHFNEENARTRAAAAYDRSFYPDGTGRQLAAIFAAGNRTDQIARITTPTLVIHGEQDSLIDVSGGHHTAEVIVDAELLLFEDMGHDLPRPLWDTLMEAITAHIAAAEERS